MEKNDRFGYAGKACVVTGASSGIGKATAELLVELGAAVYALDAQPCPVAGIAGFFPVNLGEKESIDASFAQLPKEIHHFFGVAGVSGMRTGFEDTVVINFVANKYIVETYLSSRMAPNGSIGFITSNGGNGWEKPGNLEEYLPIIAPEGWEATIEALHTLGMSSLSGICGYTLSKLAMNYYIAHLQKSFAARHIRVNGVLPAGTQSGLTDEFGAVAGGSREALVAGAGYAGRIAEAAEMAAPLVFLCSDMASFVSGALLRVDYGSYVEMEAGLRESRAPTLAEIKQMMQSRA